MHPRKDKRNLDVEVYLCRQKMRRFTEFRRKGREKTETEFYYYRKLVYRITSKEII